MGRKVPFDESNLVDRIGQKLTTGSMVVFIPPGLRTLTIGTIKHLTKKGATISYKNHRSQPDSCNRPTDMIIKLADDVAVYYKLTGSFDGAYDEE